MSLEATAEEAKDEDLEQVIIDSDGDRYFQLRVQLPPQEEEKLVTFFKKNVDVFAQSAYKALGVDPDLICYHLNVNPTVTPKKQPL